MIMMVIKHQTLFIYIYIYIYYGTWKKLLLFFLSLVYLKFILKKKEKKINTIKYKFYCCTIESVVFYLYHG